MANQDQTTEEHNGDHEKDDDADVRIAGAPAKLGRESEQPGESGSRHQGRTQHAQPVTGKQHQYRTLRVVGDIGIRHLVTAHPKSTRGTKYT